MIDTLRFNIDIQPPQFHPKGKNGWRESKEFFSPRFIYHPDYATNPKSKKKSVITVFVKYDKDTKKPNHAVEASLMRVLWGDNRWLIRNQKELDDALEKLAGHLRDLDPNYSDDVTPTRIDLTWHVPGNVPKFIDAHLELEHPLIHNGKFQMWREETALWYRKKRTIRTGGKPKRQTRSEFRIQFYDKKKKLVGRPSSQPCKFVRISVELRSGAIESAISNLIPRGRFSFARSYAMLRETILLFEESWTYQRPFPKLRIAARKRLRKNDIDWRKLLPKTPPKKFIRDKYGDIPILRGVKIP